MLDYLTPHDGPVIKGLEQHERTYAKDQPEYKPLRCLVSPVQGRVLSRWDLTEEQRKAVAEGADIFLVCCTFGKPLQPILMAVGDDNYKEEDLAGLLGLEI
jgi:hypothetical protein